MSEGRDKPHPSEKNKKKSKKGLDKIKKVCYNKATIKRTTLLKTRKG